MYCVQCAVGNLTCLITMAFEPRHSDHCFSGTLSGSIYVETIGVVVGGEVHFYSALSEQRVAPSGGVTVLYSNVLKCRNVCNLCTHSNWSI